MIFNCIKYFHIKKKMFLWVKRSFCSFADSGCWGHTSVAFHKVCKNVFIILHFPCCHTLITKSSKLRFLDFEALDVQYEQNVSTSRRNFLTFLRKHMDKIKFQVDNLDTQVNILFYQQQNRPLLFKKLLESSSQ